MAIIEQNQTIFDICIQEFGTLENLFDDVLVPNKTPIDEDINTGKEINIDATGKGDKTIKDTIKEQGLIYTNVDIKKPANGIGEMIIDFSFIVT